MRVSPKELQSQSYVLIRFILSLTFMFVVSISDAQTNMKISFADEEIHKYWTSDGWPTEIPSDARIAGGVEAVVDVQIPASVKQPYICVLSSGKNLIAVIDPRSSTEYSVGDADYRYIGTVRIAGGGKARTAILKDATRSFNVKLVEGVGTVVAVFPGSVSVSTPDGLSGESVLSLAEARPEPQIMLKESTRSSTSGAVPWPLIAAGIGLCVVGALVGTRLLKKRPSVR